MRFCHLTCERSFEGDRQRFIVSEVVVSFQVRELVWAGNRSSDDGVRVLRVHDERIRKRARPRSGAEVQFCRKGVYLQFVKRAGTECF